MAVEAGQVSVGTAATLIDATDTMPWTLRVHNNDNSDALYIGGAAVTTTTGIQLVKLETLEVHMQPGDRLYAVSSKSGHTLSWLKITKTR